MDMSFAESMGVNVDNLLISPPASAENLLCAVNTLVRSGSVDVIVVDTVRLPTFPLCIVLLITKCPISLRFS